MVGVVQLVERQVVILNVAGSSPVTHPNGQGGFGWPAQVGAAASAACRDGACPHRCVPTGEIFAGAVVALSDVPGCMWAIVLPAEGRSLGITRVQLEPKHLNSIRELKLAPDAL